MALVPPYDKRQIDERTVAMFPFCGWYSSEVENPEEHQRIDKIVEHIGDWHRYTYYAVYDLDSTARIEVGGDWGMVGQMDSAGPEEALERLSSIVDDKELSESLIFESFDENRCPFRLSSLEAHHLGDVPLSLADLPVRRLASRDIRRPIDRTVVTGLLASGSEFLAQMELGILELNFATASGFDMDNPEFLHISGGVTIGDKVKFLRAQGYERRDTVEGHPYYANELVPADETYRKFIYVDGAMTYFASDESVLADAIRAHHEEARSLHSSEAHRILATFGVAEVGGGGFFTMITPEALSGLTEVDVDVDWLTASMAYRESIGGPRSINIGFYFPSPEGAERNETDLKERLPSFESSVESRQAGMPEQPFDEWCESITTNTVADEEGSVLTATCELDRQGPAPAWAVLVDNGDLGFLRPSQ